MGGILRHPELSDQASQDSQRGSLLPDSLKSVIYLNDWPANLFIPDPAEPPSLALKFSD